MTEPDNRTTRSTYDGAGNVATVTNHANRVSRYKYDHAGNLTHVWGDVPNPVKFAYNDLGQRTGMTTYRSGSWASASLPSGFSSGGDLTSWSYDAATGLLNYKETADLSRVNYTYDDLGRVSKRTDARGWITDYHYNGQSQAGSGNFNGLLRKIDYLDAYTTDVEYTYHRTGKAKTIKDAAGTRSFNYYESWSNDDYWSELRDKSGRLQSETLPAYLGGHVMTYDYQFDVSGKWNGELSSATIGNSGTYQAAYQYDAVGRVAAIGYKTQNPFHYAYEPNANLVDTITRKATPEASAYTYQRDYGYEANSDRLAGIAHRWAADANKQSTATFTYNTLGLLQTEKTHLGANLRTAFGIASTASYGFHQEHTYTSRDEIDISARYQLTSSGGIGPVLSGFSRSYDYDAIGNRTLDHVGAYVPNSVNQYTDTPHDNGQAITHDENGNMTHDGKRSYSYDGENRVRQIVQNGATYQYAYDYMGRRISKKTVGGSETRFLYDGWDLVAEMNSSGAITRKFVWGTDVSGTLQGADGVGGLLMIEDGTQQYFPVYDSGHNVTALYDQDGNVDAVYEYDAFGNLVNSGGSYASQNPFRFSTKYTDSETGLVYYGLRYYNPESGRFVNRDPIEEAGGLNLYGFVGNNPVNAWDVLGMYEVGDQVTIKGAGTVTIEEIRENGEVVVSGSSQTIGEVDNMFSAWSADRDGFMTVFDSLVGGTFGEMSFGLLEGGPMYTESSWDGWAQDEGYGLARSEQARPQNYYEVWSSLGDARGPIDGVGLANNLIVLATDEAAMLAKGGQFRLDANRVRSLKYFGNQYDPAELVQMAKNNQLRLAKISKVAGGAGYVLTGVNVAADIYMVSNGDLSAGRFLYRSAGNAAVITLAVAGSGGAAAIVGIGWYAGEQTYDHVIRPGIEKGAELNVRTENWLRDRALNQVRY